MYEVEMKAEITEEGYHKFNHLWVQHLTNISQYIDIYYDHKDNRLKDSERELRIRQVLSGQVTTIFVTYKESPFDDLSKSKPEHEVVVDNFETMVKIVEGLGYLEEISLEKACHNYRLHQKGYEYLLTTVFVEELNRYFLEVEIQETDLLGIPSATKAIYDFLESVGIQRHQLTHAYYTDMVSAYRLKK